MSSDQNKGNSDPIGDSEGNPWSSGICDCFSDGRMCVVAAVPGLNYFSLAQSYMVYEGKENFYDDYGCGVAVPVVGTVGCATATLSSAGAAVAVLIAIIEVVASAGAGAEAAVLGAVAAAVGAGTVAFLGVGCMIAPCGQMCMMRNKLIEEKKLDTCCSCPAGVDTCCCVFWCFGCTQCQMQREMLKMREDKHDVLADKKQIYLLEPDVTSSMADDGAKDK